MKIGTIKRGRRRYFYALVPTRYLNPEETSRGMRPRVMAGSREEVRGKWTEEIAKRKKGIDLAGAETTISGFFGWWLDFYQSEGGVSERTWNDYVYQAEKNILPYLGAIRLGDMSSGHVDDWKRKLRTRGMGDRSVEYAEAVLRRSLQFAVERNYIDRNPASARVRVAKRQRRVKPGGLRIKFLTPDDLAKLLEAARGDRFEALYRLAVDTGMRPGELLGLRWKDVDLDAATLVVRQVLAKTRRRKGEIGPRHQFRPPKTDLSQRPIEFSLGTADALREQAHSQELAKLAAGGNWDGSDLVFTTGRGTLLEEDNVRHHFQNLCEANTLPRYRLYDLRHTTASLLLAEGHSVKDVQARLGHSTAKLTLDTYAHVLPGSGRKLADTMGRLLSARKPDEGKPAGGRLTEEVQSAKVIVIPDRKVS